MSTCSCGVGGSSSIRKPVEETKYANVEQAFNPIMKSKGKRYTNFELFLIVVIVGILFLMLKDMKC